MSAAISLQPGQGLSFILPPPPTLLSRLFETVPTKTPTRRRKKKDIGKMEPDVCGMVKKKAGEEEVLGVTTQR